MRKLRGAPLLVLGVLLIFLLAACQAAPPSSSGSEPPASASASRQESDPAVSSSDSSIAKGNTSQPSSSSQEDLDAEHVAQPDSSSSQDPPQQPEQPAQPPKQDPPAQEDPKPETTSNNHTLYILMYHHVVEGDGSNCNDWMITTQRLREDLQWLKDHGYTSMLPSELASGAPLPDKAVLITFDDGYASNYQLALPLLEEFDAKAVVAVIAKRIEDGVPDFLTWDMCRAMVDSGLVEIGSHSYDSHREDPRGIKRMSGESREEYEARIFTDLETSIQLIEDHVGQDVLFFAYPHGQTESWASDFLAEHFAVTVTTRHGPANISNGLYDLPRHNITVREPVSKYLPD